MWKLVENPSMRDTDIEAWARAYADANDVVAKWLGPGAAKKLASHAKKKIEEIRDGFLAAYFGQVSKAEAEEDLNSVFIALYKVPCATAVAIPVKHAVGSAEAIAAANIAEMLKDTAPDSKTATYLDRVWKNPEPRHMEQVIDLVLRCAMDQLAMKAPASAPAASAASASAGASGGVAGESASAVAAARVLGRARRCR